jgi:hypothetical protein
MTSLTFAAVEAAHAVALVLTQALDDVPDPEDVRPGWIALGSFLLLALVTVLLWLSMRKQLGKIRFDEDGEPSPAASTEDEPVDDEPAESEHAADPRRSEEHAENGDQRA